MKSGRIVLPVVLSITHNQLEVATLEVRRRRRKREDSSETIKSVRNDTDRKQYPLATQSIKLSVQF